MGAILMRAYIRLLSSAFVHLVGGAALFVMSGAALQAQYALPPPTNGAQQAPAGPLKVRSWARPRHPSMVGKSIAELALQITPTANIPLWTGTDPNFPNDQFMMVGLDPTVKQRNPVSTIKAQVIPVKF